MDFRLDPTTHDLVFDDGGDIILQDSADSIAQDIKIRLGTFLGEWFLDPDIGMLDFTHWFGPKNPDLNLLRSQVKAQIEQVEGVTQCNFVTFDYNNATRKVSIRFSAQGAVDPITGEVILSSVTPSTPGAP